MTIEDFINSRLQKMAEPVKTIDIGETPLEEAVLARVHSKKFRKLHVDQAAIENAKKAIAYSVERDEPVRLTLHFGGNKLWRLDEAPHIDWAELFSLIYYVNWAKYIAGVYKPGVLVEYFSMDVCVERLNGVPHEETDQYSEDMKKLFEWIGPYIPDGVELQYTRYGDLYESRDAYYKELDVSIEKWLESNNGKLPELDDAQKIATELNVKLKPAQDEDPEWREKVELEHQGIFGTKTGGAYISDPTMIPHCPTWYSGYIATGSTKRSIAKFWAGVGALENTEDSFAEIVLSPKQLEKAQFEWVPTNIEGLEGKNFKNIRVLKKEFN